MREFDDTYWWYRALRENVVRHLERVLGNAGTSPSILDAGCGTGGTLAALRKRYPEARLIGLDFSPDAVAITRNRGVATSVTRGTVNRLPFDDAVFDAAISLDVLVHAAVDEHAATAELRRVLKPGAPLLLNLAAFDSLWGPHNEAVHDCRRFSPARVRTLAQRHGLAVDFLTCWNMTLTPAIWMWRRLGLLRKSVTSDLRPVPPWVNDCLRTLAGIELRIARNVPLPFGTSVFAVLRKHLAPAANGALHNTAHSP